MCFYITRAEIADFLQVCIRTVDRMCENGHKLVINVSLKRPEIDEK